MLQLGFRRPVFDVFRSNIGLPMFHDPRRAERNPRSSGKGGSAASCLVAERESAGENAEGSTAAVAVLEWLQHLPVFVTIAESGSIWGYPTILVLHTAGLALVVGSAMVVNARDCWAWAVWRPCPHLDCCSRSCGRDLR